MSKPSYTLYGGESEDGRGAGKYIGRTTDKDKAIKHFKKVSSNPYSTGRVVIQTDTSETVVWRLEDFQ